MRKNIQTIVIGSLVIVAYDALASAISTFTGFPYGLFSVGSSLICLLFGFLIGRNSRWFFGAAAGAFIGLVESTVGWAISWYIGPGKPTMELNGLMIVATIIFVVAVGAFLGFIGGLGSLVLKRSA